MTDPSCLFCRIIAGEIPATKVHEDDLVRGHRRHQPRGARAPAPHAPPPRRLGRRPDRGATPPWLGRLFAVAAAARRRRRPARAGLPARHQHRRRRGPVRAAPARPPARRTRASPGRPGDAAARSRRRACAAAALLLGASLRRLRQPRPTARARAETVALPTPHALASTPSVCGDGRASSRRPCPRVGSRLEVPAGAYRPSEPAVAAAGAARGPARRPRRPRRGLRGRLRGAGCAPRPAALAAELAAYLGSGFGQTNFPADTRFSVAVLDDTVVFTSWSPGRSSDRERGEAVFEALAVGRAAGRGRPVAAQAAIGAARPSPPRRRGQRRSSGLADLEGDVVAGPGAHLVAADLERVRAREVGLRPEPPADDALVHREVGVGGLDDARRCAARTVGLLVRRARAAARRGAARPG